MLETVVYTCGDIAHVWVSPADGMVCVSVLTPGAGVVDVEVVPLRGQIRTQADLEGFARKLAVDAAVESA